MRPGRNDWAFMTEITKGVKKGQPVDRDAITYFHKGQHPVKFSSGITQDEIDGYHKKSYKPTEQESKAVFKTIYESTEVKCKRKCDYVSSMKQLYEKRKSNYVGFDDKLAVDVVIEVLKKYNQPIGLYPCKNYAEWLMAEVNEKQFKERVLDMLRPRQ